MLGEFVALQVEFFFERFVVREGDMQTCGTLLEVIP